MVSKIVLVKNKYKLSTDNLDTNVNERIPFVGLGVIESVFPMPTDRTCRKPPEALVRSSWSWSWGSKRGPKKYDDLNGTGRHLVAIPFERLRFGRSSDSAAAGWQHLDPRPRGPGR